MECDYRRLLNFNDAEGCSGKLRTSSWCHVERQTMLHRKISILCSAMPMPVQYEETDKNKVGIKNAATLMPLPKKTDESVACVRCRKDGVISILPYRPFLLV